LVLAALLLILLVDQAVVVLAALMVHLIHQAVQEEQVLQDRVTQAVMVQFGQVEVVEVELPQDTRAQVHKVQLLLAQVDQV
jgi:hypothetical protein